MKIFPVNSDKYNFNKCRCVRNHGGTETSRRWLPLTNRCSQRRVVNSPSTGRAAHMYTTRDRGKACENRVVSRRQRKRQQAQQSPGCSGTCHRWPAPSRPLNSPLPPRHTPHAPPRSQKPPGTRTQHSTNRERRGRVPWWWLFFFSAKVKSCFFSCFSIPHSLLNISLLNKKVYRLEPTFALICILSHSG